MASQDFQLCFVTSGNNLWRFCVSRKGGTGGGWQVHLQGAYSMAASGLSCRKTLVGAGWPISGKNGLRNKLFHLVGSLFQHLGSIFQLHQVGIHLNCNFAKWGAWLESCICLGWLKLPLGAVLSPTAQGSRKLK